MENLINYVNEGLSTARFSPAEREHIIKYADTLAWNTASPNPDLNLIKGIIKYLAQGEIHISIDRRIKKQQKETIKMCKEIKEKMGW